MTREDLVVMVRTMIDTGYARTALHMAEKLYFKGLITCGDYELAVGMVGYAGCN